MIQQHTNQHKHFTNTTDYVNVNGTEMLTQFQFTVIAIIILVIFMQYYNFSYNQIKLYNCRLTFAVKSNLPI